MCVYVCEWVSSLQTQNDAFVGWINAVSRKRWKVALKALQTVEAFREMLSGMNVYWPAALQMALLEKRTCIGLPCVEHRIKYWHKKWYRDEGFLKVFTDAQ